MFGQMSANTAKATHRNRAASRQLCRLYFAKGVGGGGVCWGFRVIWKGLYMMMVGKELGKGGGGGVRGAGAKGCEVANMLLYRLLKGEGAKRQKQQGRNRVHCQKEDCKGASNDGNEGYVILQSKRQAYWKTRPDGGSPCKGGCKGVRRRALRGFGNDAHMALQRQRSSLLEDSARWGVSLQQCVAFAFRLIKPGPSLG